jgi:hypothetical protein
MKLTTKTIPTSYNLWVDKTFVYKGSLVLVVVHAFASIKQNDYSTNLKLKDVWTGSHQIRVSLSTSSSASHIPVTLMSR